MYKFHVFAFLFISVSSFFFFFSTIEFQLRVAGFIGEHGKSGVYTKGEQK